MKNELNIEIAKFKAEIEDKILEVNEEFLQNKDEEAIKMLDILRKKAKNKENDIFDKSIMNQKQYVYNPLVGIALLFELLNYFKLLAEHQTKIDDIEKDLNKIRDIKDNIEILEEIKDNLIEFQSIEKMKDFILNDDRKIIEKRDFLLELLQNLKEAEHFEENSSNIDKAIKTLINFQNISEMRRDNVFFIKDYINEKFGVDFNIQNLFDIKQVAEHIKSAAERENFEARFEDITFKNTDFNQMIQEVFKEAEQEQIKEEEVELER